MFDSLAFLITLAASVIPAVGKLLVTSLRRTKDGEREVTVRYYTQKTGMPPASWDGDEKPPTDSQPERYVADSPPRRASVFSALLGVVAVLLAGFFADYLNRISRNRYAIGASSNDPSIPRFNRPLLLEAIIWLSAREWFYQLLLLILLFAVVLIYKRRIAGFVTRLDPSRQVLLGFACIVVYFGCSATIHYWGQIAITGDKFYLALGLFFTMVAGMFVQVITSNAKDGANLFAVSAGQLIYPVLFSPIVYYAIWVVASASGTTGLFSFYAAFLNGYFWQSVVTSAQKVGGVSGTKSS